MRNGATIILTMAEDGIAIIQEGNSRIFPAESILRDVNSTGAGDTLLGATVAAHLACKVDIYTATSVGMSAAMETLQSDKAVSPVLTPEWLEECLNQ